MQDFILADHGVAVKSTWTKADRVWNMSHRIVRINEYCHGPGYLPNLDVPQ